MVKYPGSVVLITCKVGESTKTDINVEIETHRVVPVEVQDTHPN